MASVRGAVRRLIAAAQMVATGRAPGEGSEFRRALHAVTASVGDPPLTFVDVGAGRGAWTRQLLAVAPGAAGLLVEAQLEMQPALAALSADHRSLDVRIAVVGARKADVAPFYIVLGDEHRSGSSLRRELTRHPMVERTLPVVTLDEVVEGSSLARRPIALMKLDVQGSELDVLSGAPRTLGRTSFVQLEVSFVAYNEGAPMVEDVIGEMLRFGFVPVDLFDRRYASGRLLQADVLFGRARPGVEDLIRR